MDALRTISNCCFGSRDDSSSFRREDEDTFEEWDIKNRYYGINGCMAPEDNPFVGRYTFRGEVGRGSFATVYLVTSDKTGEEFACKVVDKRKVSFDENLRDQIIQNHRDENYILERLNHPNVIRLVEFVETTHRMFIMTELLRGGDLFDYIVSKGALPEADACKVVKEVMQGLAYMHSHGVIHRDLKPENLLLVQQGCLDRIKIVDFGFSKALLHRLATSYTGTAGYLAPEVRQGRPYTSSVDIWAAGIIFYILLSGRMPFPLDTSPFPVEAPYGTTDKASDSARAPQPALRGYKLNFPEKIWDHVSDSAKDLVTMMLRLDPQLRPNAAEVLAHPWFVSAPEAIGSTFSPFIKPKPSTASRPIAVPPKGTGSRRNSQGQIQTPNGAVYTRFSSFYIEPHTERRARYDAFQDMGAVSSHRTPVPFQLPPGQSITRRKSFTARAGTSGDHC